MTFAVALWALADRRSIWLTATPLVICGCVLLQLVPLPDSVLVGLAPVSAGAWKVAHGGDSTLWGRITVDPAATLQASRRLLIGLATIAVVIGLGRYQSRRKQLIAAVAISGVIILSLGLLIGHNTKHYSVLGYGNLAWPLNPNQSALIAPVESAGVGQSEWITVQSQRYQADFANVGDGLGPYIYSNHFAGGVELSLPILLAVGLFLTSGRLHDGARYSLVGIVCLAALWAVGGLADSRAGVGSLGLACIALMSIVLVKRWPKRIAGTMLIVCTVAILGFLIVLLGSFKAITELLPPDWQNAAIKILTDARVVSAQVAVRMFLASPLLGTGLDTYQAVYSRFYPLGFTLYYAHNDYAQLLAETGLVGAVLTFMLISPLAMRFAKFYREARGEYRTLNAGPWAAVAGIATHSAFDWNLHLPANAFLTCLVIGLSASSVPSPAASKVDKVIAWIPEAAPRWALVFCCALSLVFLARDAVSENNQRQLSTAIVAGRTAMEDGDKTATSGRLTAAIAAGQSMALWDSGNAQLTLLVGQANLHLASLVAAGPARETFLGTADKWFQRAKRLRATKRGLPEALPRDHKPDGR
jgi:hypothetical protein